MAAANNIPGPTSRFRFLPLGRTSVTVAVSVPEKLLLELASSFSPKAFADFEDTPNFPNLAAETPNRLDTELEVATVPS